MLTATTATNPQPKTTYGNTNTCLTQVVKILGPGPLLRSAGESSGGMEGRKEGDAMPGSYVNHYLCNGGVVVPQFGGIAAERDAAAMAVLRGCHPDRAVVGVDSRAILCGGGNIHCATMQQPA